MSLTTANLVVNSVNWSPSSNTMNVQVDLVDLSNNKSVTSLFLDSIQDGSIKSSYVSQTVTPAFVDASGVVTVPVTTPTLISLLSTISATGTAPYVRVTGYTYADISGNTYTVKNTTFWQSSEAQISAFMLASSTYLKYNSPSDSTFSYYSYNYTPIGLTINPVSGTTTFNGDITPSTTSVTQSTKLEPVATTKWTPGITYDGSLNYSSSTSVFGLSNQVLAIKPIQLPDWNPIQYDITDNIFNMRTYFPKQFFDLCGNTNSRYDSPYFGYDSSAQVITTINYSTKTKTTGTLVNNSLIQTDTTSSGLTAVKQFINDVSGDSMWFNSITDLSSNNVQKIDSISYQVKNSVDSITVNNPFVALPSTYAFVANDISLNVPSLTILTNNNTIQLDASASSIASGVANNNINSISTLLRDASGNVVANSSNLNYFNTTAGKGFNSRTFPGNNSYDGTYNIQVSSQDAYGNSGIVTTIPVDYSPSIVGTAITATKVKYNSTTGAFISLDLSLNETNTTRASVTTIPMNQNNYFVASLDPSFNVSGTNYNLPATSKTVTISASYLSPNTVYLPTIVNKVADTVGLYYNNDSTNTADLYTVVNYTDLSSNGTITRQNVYVYDSSTASVAVSTAWAGTATNYNLLTMQSPLTSVNLATQRMFVNPQVMSWVVMNNEGSSPDNFYAYSFLRPNFILSTFNTYSAYYQNQFLNSYTMYDYLNISGLTGTSSVALPVTGIVQTFNTNYNSNNNNSSETSKQQLFKDIGSHNVVNTGFSLDWAEGDYDIIKSYNLTAEVDMIETLNNALDASSNNTMGFNNVVVTVNNPTLASFTVSSITLLLIRKNQTLQSNNGDNRVLVTNITQSSPTLVATNTTSNQYVVNVSNITNVLQGTYKMYAIVSLTSINNGLGVSYNVNLLSAPSDETDYYYKYPEIVQTVYTNSTGKLLTMINNSYVDTTTFSIDNVDIKTIAQSVFPSRVISTQLNIPNSASKTMLAELSLPNSNISNYYNITTTTGNSATNTVVTEYTPSQSFVNL